MGNQDWALLPRIITPVWLKVLGPFIPILLSLLMWVVPGRVYRLEGGGSLQLGGPWKSWELKVVYLGTVKSCKRLRCTAWYFETHTYCETITTIKLINKSITSHSYYWERQSGVCRLSALISLYKNGPWAWNAPSLRVKEPTLPVPGLPPCGGTSFPVLGSKSTPASLLETCASYSTWPTLLLCLSSMERGPMTTTEAHAAVSSLHEWNAFPSVCGVLLGDSNIKIQWPEVFRVLP